MIIDFIYGAVYMLIPNTSEFIFVYGAKTGLRFFFIAFLHLDIQLFSTTYKNTFLSLFNTLYLEGWLGSNDTLCGNVWRLGILEALDER